MSFASPTASTKIADSYMKGLLAGDREFVRKLVDDAQKAGIDAAFLLSELIWPTMERMQQLYKDDQITHVSLNLATRLNRQTANQLAAKLTISPSNGRKVLIFCGNDEPEELGGQICADLFEAAGYTVRFGGGGVPGDEVLKLVGTERPNLLILFATLPSGVPGVRKLIDYLRDINCCPEMQIMCCGGIYKRAEGLAEEIGADLYAPDAFGAVEMATQTTRRASVEQQTVGRMRRIKKAAARKAEATRLEEQPVGEPLQTRAA